MAGLAERAGPSDDSFWTWREVMYGFVASLTPEQVEAIAAQLYVEMLKAGYTAVGEFHYLHHGPDGQPYEDLAEMSRRVIAAAGATGIGLTHLPVLYGYGGFGGQAAGAGQRRFLNDPERYLRLLQDLQGATRADGQLALGIAPHSLRAVTAESLTTAIAGLNALDSEAPIHIHIAEQVKEVEDCIAWSGRRPVEWLYQEVPVDRRWCLVHATHMTAAETRQLAESGAVAGLCPTTEANLGDGIFPAIDFAAAGGNYGIGSDSHISVSPVEELRWLEYGQRLIHRRRNLLSGGVTAPSVGRQLYDATLKGGTQALGRPIGQLAAGCRADLLVLDEAAPVLAGKAGDMLLDAMIFAGNVNPLRDVMVGGRWVVTEGRHHAEEPILARYRQVLAQLTKVRSLRSHARYQLHLSLGAGHRPAPDDRRRNSRCRGAGLRPRAGARRSSSRGSTWSRTRLSMATSTSCAAISRRSPGLAGVKIVGDYVDNYKSGPALGDGLSSTSSTRGTACRWRCLDATAITEMRTGAMTALGAKYLARRNSRKLGHIGARGSAYWNVRLLAHLFELEEIKVHSRRRESREPFAARLERGPGQGGGGGR